MKKKKLALLMVAALTFTNLDGTVVALKAADFAVDLSEETTDEFGDVETPDEQKEEASDIEIEDTDEVGEDLESTEDFDEQQGLDIFSDGEEIECESDQTGISGIHEVVADEYVTLEEGTQKLSITENTRNEFGLFDFTCEFTPKEDGYYVFELSGNDDIVTNITLEDRWSVGEDDYYNDTNASTKPFCLGARLKKGKTYSYNLSIVDMGQLSVSIAKKEEKQIKNVRLAGLENIDTNSFQLFQELKDIFGIEVTYADNSAKTYRFDQKVNDTNRNWNISDSYGNVIWVNSLRIESQIKDSYITYKVQFSYKDYNKRTDIYTDTQSISCKSLASLTQIQPGKVYNIPTLNENQMPGKGQGFCFIPGTSGYYIFEKNGAGAENYFSIDKVWIEGGSFGRKDLIKIENVGGSECKGQNKGKIYLEAGEVYLIRGRKDSENQPETISFIIRDENKICDWKEISRTAPTCMKAGEIVEKCQNHPNEALKKTKIPALGHKYSAWTVTKKATAVTTGTRERNCTVCKKAKQIEPIAKLKPTAKLNVVAGTLPLKVKQAFTVKVTGLSKGDSVAAWTSSNSKVAIVKNGKITAKKVGNVRITVKLKSGLTKTIKVRVQKTDVATQSLKVNNKVSGKKIASNVTLKLKQTLKLSTEITPVTSKQKVTYATSNKKVATVNSKGVVTAKKKGKVTITVKSGKKTVKIKVTVK